MEVKRLVEDVCVVCIEKEAPDVINIQYPSGSNNAYLRSEIRLEIGPLAQWVPNAEYDIRSYVAEVFPDVVDEPVHSIRTIKAERTFWEKVTILHQEAFRPDEKPQPARYSRHYYDLAVPGTLRLIPQANMLKNLKEDYTRMHVMFYAEYPDFSDMMLTLEILEREINALDD